MRPCLGRLIHPNAVILARIPYAPGLQNAVAVRIPRPPQIGVEPFERLIQPTEIVLVASHEIIDVQRRCGETVALEHAIVGHQMFFGEVDISPRHERRVFVPALRFRRIARDNHARQPSVSPLGLHKYELVIQPDLQIAIGIHGSAHRLRFQPDVRITASLDDNFSLGAEFDDIVACSTFCLVIQMLQEGVVGFQSRAHLGQLPRLFRCRERTRRHRKAETEPRAHYARF